MQNVQTFRHALPSQAHDRDSIISTRESGEADGAMTPTGRAVMPGHRSMSEYRRSVLSAEREIASLDGYARDSCPGCGGVRIGGCGVDDNGIRRWYHEACGKTLTPTVGTISGGTGSPCQTGASSRRRRSSSSPA